MKRLFALMLMLCLFALPAAAETVDDVKYLDANGQEQTADNVTLLTNQTSLTSGWYLVRGNVSIGRKKVSGDVHLILEDDCVLTAGSGINVTGSDSLTIYAQSTGESMGSLTANSSGRNAAIGGNDGQAGGVITINGGKVTANAKCNQVDWGAGIGGGDGGSGGTITINGGIVVATGSFNGAGIGGGDGGAGGVITINGGTVTGKSSHRGAGIGGGDDGAGGIITICSSANVSASSITGEGIGSGGSTQAGYIRFNGNSGKVHRSYTLSQDFTLASGKELEVGGTLRVPNGRTLTVEDGATLNGSGTLDMTGGGSLVVEDGGILGDALTIRWGVTQSLTNITSSGNNYATNKADYTARLTPNAHYALPPSIAVTVDGITLADTAYAYSSETGELTIPKESITGAVVITAVGVKLHAITFDPNGGTLSGDAAADAGKDGKLAVLPEPSRTGYAFTGWFTAATDGEKITTSTVFTTDTTIYAQWQANAYTVEFDANGGRGEMESQTFAYDEAQKLRENAFTLTGYSFNGWKAELDGTETFYEDEAEVQNLTAEKDGTVTLHAQWQANAYTVRFEANGGSGAMADQAFAFDQALPLSENKYEREGYTFLGWNTKADETGKFYADGNEVVNLTEENGGMVTLYAVWGVNAVIDSPTQEQMLDVIVGDSVTLSITAQNATGYQWYVSRDGKRFEEIEGATQPTLTLEALTLADDGLRYSCQARNNWSFMNSAPVTLRVTEPAAPALPQTGDHSRLALWSSALALCGAAFLLRRRRTN